MKNKKVLSIIIFTGIILSCCNKETSPPEIQNQLPLCSILSPSENETFTEGDTVNIIIDAEDKDGEINHVSVSISDQYYWDTQTEPYECKYITSEIDIGELEIDITVVDDQYDEIIVSRNIIINGSEVEMYLISIDSVETRSVKVNYEVATNGGYKVTEHGICWSENPYPTVDDYFETDSSGTGSFSIVLENLTAGTTYYLRPYAINETGIKYGEENTFSTANYGFEVVNGIDWFVEFVFFNPNLGYSIYPYFNKITDKGKKFEMLPDLSGSDLAACFPDERTGFIVTQEQIVYREKFETVIYKTVDYGNNWSEIYRYPMTKSLEFRNSTMKVVKDDLILFNSLYYGSADNIFILYSKDDGNTWHDTIFVNADADWNIKFFFSSQETAYRTSYNEISITDNFGNTWQTLQNFGSNDIVYFKMFTLNEGICIIEDYSTLYAAILTTDDGWNSYHSTEILIQDPKYSSHKEIALFLSKNIGWLKIWGKFIKTNDGGESWTDLQFDKKIDYIYFIDEWTGWIISDKKLYYTDNGGLPIYPKK